MWNHYPTTISYPRRDLSPWEDVMRAIVEEHECILETLNTDQGELDAMASMWEEKYYVDVPEDLVNRYNSAWQRLCKICEELRSLAEKQGKRVL